jgi:hypothetical protein
VDHFGRTEGLLDVTDPNRRHSVISPRCACP